MSAVKEARPATVETEMRTRWYDQNSFGDLSVAALNGLDPLSARIDVALPLISEGDSGDEDSILTINKRPYTVFRVEIYRVGKVVYAQGYKDPESGQDIPITSLSDWFSLAEGKSQGGELIGITQMNKSGQKIKSFDRRSAPIFSATPEGAINLQLQAPDFLIDPEIVHAVIEGTRNEHPNTFKKALGMDLLQKYGPEYIEKMEANDLEWSHQPAAATATGIAILSQEETDPEKQFKGWVSSPTGSGKTEMEMQLMESAIPMSDGTIVFVTSRSILLDQIQKKLENKFGKENICRYDQEDKRTDRKIIITTYHSAMELFNSMYKKKTEIPVVVWDEAHNLLQQRRGLSQHKALKKSVQCAYTATPGLDYTLTDLGFSEILTVPLAYTIETGVTPPIAIKRTVLKLQEKIDEASETKELTKIDEAQIEFNLSVRAKIQNFLEESIFEYNGEVTIRPTFIEVDSIDEGKIITAELQKILKTRYAEKLDNQIGFIHSNQSKAKNTQIVEDAIAGTINVIVGVNMISEGLDIPKYEVIILKPWRKSEYRPFQDMGRVMRKNANGNPCLVIEIWPLDDADIQGYRSALQIIGVSKGDPRVSFRNQKQYTKAVHALESAFTGLDIDTDTEKAFKTPLQFTIRSTRGKRERKLVGISEFQQIANLIIPKYRDYLSSGGAPITALRFSKRSDQMKLYPNPNEFEKIIGFRWWLLPYFRLDTEQIQSLAKLMYDEEVVLGLKKPFDSISTASGLHAYIRGVIKQSQNPWELPRSVIIKTLSSAFQKDFSISSMEYTVTALANKLLTEDSENERITLAYFLDKIRFLGLIETPPPHLSYLLPHNIDIQTPMEYVFQYMYREIERRITTIVTNLDTQMKGYVHAGANIDSDVFHARNSKEIYEINEFIQRISKVTTAIRFDTTLLRSSRRGVKIVTDIYGRVREKYEKINYSEADQARLVQLLASRLKRHAIVRAEDVPTVFSTNFDLVFGIPYRALDAIARSKNLTAPSLLSLTARSIDPQYERSYELFIRSLDPNVVAEKIALALVAADVDVMDIKTDTLLTMKTVKGAYILPRIYVDAAFLSRSDGRTRAALKSYVTSDEMLNINLSEFMDMIKTKVHQLQKKN